MKIKYNEYLSDPIIMMEVIDFKFKKIGDQIKNGKKLEAKKVLASLIDLTKPFIDEALNEASRTQRTMQNDYKIIICEHTIINWLIKHYQNKMMNQGFIKSAIKAISSILGKWTPHRTEFLLGMANFFQNPDYKEYCVKLGTDAMFDNRKCCSSNNFRLIKNFLDFLETQGTLSEDLVTKSVQWIDKNLSWDGDLSRKFFFLSKNLGPRKKKIISEKARKHLAKYQEIILKEERGSYSHEMAVKRADEWLKVVNI